MAAIHRQKVCEHICWDDDEDDDHNFHKTHNQSVRCANDICRDAPQLTLLLHVYEDEINNELLLVPSSHNGSHDFPVVHLHQVYL